MRLDIKFLFTLIAALLATNALATPPLRDPISDRVGSSSGEFRVDEGGAATYSIPLYTVPGTAGVAPQMALSYSSNGGDGVLGKGWQLSGISTITRCRATREAGDFLDVMNAPIDGYADPINFSATDKFCLDGQRLLAELDASGAPINNVYRLELDAFTRVTAVFDATRTDGPRAFKVQRRDGTIAWYGDFNGCQLSGNLCSAVRTVANRADALVLANTLDASGTTVLRAEASAWAMNRSYDSNGNYVDFVYATDALKGEFVLAQVDFTGFAVFPGISGVPSAPYASVVMNYSTLPLSGQRSGFNAGSRFVRSKRLDSIDSKVGAVVVRHYKMNFITGTSGLGDDVLNQITECRDTSEQVCLKPTVFQWSQAQQQFADQNISSQSEFGKFVDSKIGDIDGDARADFIWVRNTSASDGCATNKIYVSRSSRNTAGQLAFSAPVDTGICTQWDSNLTGTAPLSDIRRYWQLLDYNGDGRDDLLLAQRPSVTPNAVWQVFLASSSGVGYSSTPINTPMTVYVASTTLADGILGTLQLGDFNGDGINDVLNIENNAPVIHFLERNSSDLFAFTPAYALDWQSVLPPALGCSAGDCTVRLSTTTDHLGDVNGDGRSDILLGYRLANPNLLQPEAVQSIPARAMWLLAYERTETPLRSMRLKFHASTSPNLPASERAPVADGERGDFNGDGLIDVLSCTGTTQSSCQAYLNTGLAGKNSFIAIGSVLPDSSQRKLLDVNNDGRSDLLYRPGTSPSDGPYLVMLAASDGSFGASGPLPGCSVFFCSASPFEFGTSYFADFDGDGHVDFLALQAAPNENENVRTASSGVNNAFAAYDVITTIENGYGASTIIDYLPLTNKDVYRRDQGSRNSQKIGRLSPVQDLLMPMYVVANVRSSAPTLSNPTAFSSIDYRYARAKIQGGGRGFLGFREVVSFDANYDGTGASNCGPSSDGCYIASVSSYFQEFPYIGAPNTSKTLVMAGTYTPSLCRTTGRQSDSCAQTNAVFPSLEVGLNKLVKFAAHAMACQTANGSTDICPAPYNSGTSQCYTSVRAPTLFASDRASESHKVMSNGDTVNRFASTGKPQGIFAYVLGSADNSYELQSPGGTQATSEVFNTFCYNDGNGNMTLAETQTASTSYVNVGSNAGDLGKIRSKSVRNQYIDDLVNWKLGRLVSSQVLHGVKANGASAFTSLERATEFAYQPGSAKLLSTEKLAATAAAGADPLSFAVNTFYDFDRYGNKLATYTCSSDITEALCKDPANSSNPMLMHPSGNSIRRYSRAQFDSTGRFATGMRGAFYDPTVATRLWTERATMTVLARDEFGEVTASLDANGVRGDVLRGQFGRDYYAESAAGSSSTTTYRWCYGAGDGSEEVKCPEGARFRMQVEASGRPKAWSFHDVLGRTIVTMVQSNFDSPEADKALVEVCAWYDSHGRAIRSTEPQFSRESQDGEPYFAKSFVGCDAPSTTQSFDVIGRPRTITQPDAGFTDITYAIESKTIVANGGNYLEVRSKVSKRAPDNGSTTLRTWVDIINAAGEKVEMRDPNSFAIKQSFDEVGNLTRVSRQVSASSPEIITDAIYDNLGRKISQIDPDMGSWRYQYNAMGEIVSQTDAKNQTISHQIDALGRVWKTETPGLGGSSLGDIILQARFEDSDQAPVVSGGLIVDTFVFDTAPNGLGLLTSSQRVEPGASNYTQVVSYDSLSRVSQTTTQIDAQNTTEQVVYDAIGRPFKHFTRFVDATVNYDEGTETAFNSKGYGFKVCRTTDSSTFVGNCAVSGSDLYYEAIDFDQRGQVTRERRANNVSLEVERSFDAQTGRLRVQNVNAGSLQSWQFDFDRVGNLTRRFEAQTGQTEILAYDKLDRLTNVTRNGVVSMALQYDVLGNICSKTKEGGGTSNYQYGGSSGCALNTGLGASPHQVKSAWGKSYSYDANGDLESRSAAGVNLALQYDASRMTRVLALSNNQGKSSFYYGPGGGRYKRVDEKNGAITRTVKYIGGLEKETTPGQTLIRESIGGFLLINRTITNTGTQRQYRYIFTDHLGSTDLITDENAAVIERMSFDAHGARRAVSSWQTPVLNFTPNTTLRGFTGHEMLDDLGLVHMNARIYDPELGRFLQADSMVENDATQGLNRYTYVLNNPLSLTDPTGHLSKNSIGILKAIVSIAITVFLPGSVFLSGLNAFGATLVSGFLGGVVTGGLQGGLWGAFSGGLFHGIGSGFTKIASTGKFSVGALRAGKVLAHAVAGGTLSTLQGGKFGSGFVSAGITEAVSPTIAKIGNDYAEVAAAAIVGGTTSVLSGGKFGNGAITGAFGYAFNSLKHWEQDIEWSMRHQPNAIMSDGLEGEPDNIFSDGGGEGQFGNGGFEGSSCTERCFYSADSGSVARVGWQNNADHGGSTAARLAGYGFRLRISGPNGSTFVYGHLDPASINLVEGQQVAAGQLIGQYANPTNGYSSGPHLHFEQRSAQGVVMLPFSYISTVMPNSTITSRPGNRVLNNVREGHPGYDLVRGH